MKYLFRLFNAVHARLYWLSAGKVGKPHHLALLCNLKSNPQAAIQLLNPNVV